MGEKTNVTFVRTSKSKMMKLSLMVLATLGLANSAEDSGNGNAKLLVSKRIQNKYLVEGKDVVIHYALYNVGDNAATEVVLSEVGFGPNDFDVAGGQTVVKFNRIPPKANNTHILCPAKEVRILQLHFC